ncbi:hypothetical protein Tco_0756668, partial [Tanacetum coccineum]
MEIYFWILEQLDRAGIELPNFYKWIENAEKYLQTHRPVRRHRGKLLEEGPSGFLGKRVAPEEVKATNHDVDWSSFNELCSAWATNTSVGSKNEASTWPVRRNKLRNLDSPFLVQM